MTNNIRKWRGICLYCKTKWELLESELKNIESVSTDWCYEERFEFSKINCSKCEHIFNVYPIQEYVK